MTEKKESTHKTEVKEAPQFAPLHDLIEGSWLLFQTTALSFLKLAAFTLGFFLLGTIILSIIFIGLAFVIGPSHINLYAMSPANYFLLAVALIIGILYVIWILLVVTVSSIISIFILQGKDASSITALIGQSKPYILPYIITMVLSSVLILGGIMLFFIPGLFIAVFFVFVLYEIVIEKQSGVAALSRSYIMVKNHFWDVVWRLFILEVTYLIISSLFNHLAGTDWLLRLVQFLFSVFWTWYFRAYVYTLYTEVRKRTIFPQKISITWIWVVSLVGWVIAILLSFAIVSNFSHRNTLMHHMRHDHTYQVSRGKSV
ncbi:MAG TPA: hypothetical protein VLF93_05470 [Candidatus Saccharimonadales bacterium]|nr:hypothetical protein [Candidatus Saccharimonadales bacterium]